MYELFSARNLSDTAFPVPAFDVFLSHNRRDRRSVERVAELLRREGLQPWLDAYSLTDGGPFAQEIEHGIAQAMSCAVFVGPHSVGDWQRHEIDLAVARAATESSFRLFPVLLPGVAEPFDPGLLRPELRTRTWVDLRPGVGDGRAFARLLNAIRAQAPGPTAPTDPREDVCPYRGLEVFEEEHAEFFFGRDADVQRALEKLKAGRLLAVLGPSGSGKSSLVRAGMVPALRAGALGSEHGASS